MLVQFKQAVHFSGKDYSKGIHEIPEEILKHKFFHRMIVAGLVTEVEASKVISPESVQKRQEKLAEKLMKKAVEAKKKDEVPVQVEPVLPDPVFPGDEVVEDILEEEVISEDEKEQPKSKQKTKSKR